MKEEVDIPVSIGSLLEAGVHFGHQKRRWNPKMRGFIYEERDGSDIIDLAKTMKQLRLSAGVVGEFVEREQRILFVGTKKQARVVVKECAEQCGEFYVDRRWLGGTLTNFKTIRLSIKKLENVEKQLASGVKGLTKQEMSQLDKQRQKLEGSLAGIRGMKKPPGLLVVVDPVREHSAVAEARKLGIPVMALIDTNGDPDLIDYAIPGNDDALKSVRVIVQTLSDAILAQKENLGLLSDPSDENVSSKESTQEERLETQEAESKESMRE